MWTFLLHMIVSPGTVLLVWFALIYGAVRLVRRGYRQRTWWRLALGGTLGLIMLVGTVIALVFAGALLYMASHMR